MSSASRAYTSEYSPFEGYYASNRTERTYGREQRAFSAELYAERGQVLRQGYLYPEIYPESFPQNPRVKRTRQRPDTGAATSAERAEKTQKSAIITHEVLLRIILLLIFAGAVTVSTIWMSARATELQYEINKLNKENVVLQNEISMLDIKIESANSIEQIEEYATKTLKMQYPKAHQYVYVQAGEKASDDLAQRIREKAYSE